MKRRGLLLGLCLAALLPLSGCWNSKDIQNMDYATAIGLDYVDGKYITYVQFLNFSNVGRNETVQIGKEVPIWVGRGEGATVSQSMSSIYATSQMHIFWGHVKTIVCSESLLKKGVEEAYNSINRFGEIRYNIYIFGTKEKFTDLFIQKSIFNLSPLDTIMFSPEQIYAQRSFIMPLTGNQVIAQLTEPGEPAMLPSISIVRDVWKEDKRSRPMLKIDGAYFFQGKKMQTWMAEEELAGSRWTQKQLKRSLISVPAGDHPYATLVLINPHYHVDARVKDGKARFDLSLQLDATLDDLNREVSVEELERLTEAAVREDIMDSFRKGLAKQVDVLKLEETLYRNHPKQWHLLHDKQEFLLDRDSINSITVKVHLRNTGKYKGRIR
ncbi:Ger(x)C family spore germination protein [Cohnella boryungensis]|uniref:Ger(X)C family spore germination protein n=1 Tax=Cohnella boryungensis TaxID=768479 RepID=A0ABV8SJ18_9BACL